MFFHLKVLRATNAPFDIEIGLPNIIAPMESQTAPFTMVVLEPLVSKAEAD